MPEKSFKNASQNLQAPAFNNLGQSWFSTFLLLYFNKNKDIPGKRFYGVNFGFY